MTPIVTIIQFEQPNGIYRAGEQAAFAPDAAQKFIDRGVATLVKANAPVCAPGLETLAQ